MEDDIIEFLDSEPQLELPLRTLYVKVMDKHESYIQFTEFLTAVGNLKRDGNVIEYDKLPERVPTVALV